MMEQIHLRPAHVSEAATLAAISTRAFHSDTACGASAVGGPPGHDSPQWQISMMEQAAAYLSIVRGEALIGGVIVFQQQPGEYELGRIFIDPAACGQGVGTQAMLLLFQRFPATRWRLETPPWNTRTRAFYLKFGFHIVKETADDIFFEKIVAV